MTAVRRQLGRRRARVLQCIQPCGNSNRYDDSKGIGMARSRLAARSAAVRHSLGVTLTAAAALAAASSRDVSIWNAPVSPSTRSARLRAATNEASLVQSTRATAAHSMSRGERRTSRRPLSGKPHCRQRSGPRRRSCRRPCLRACSNSHERPGAGLACLRRRDAVHIPWPASPASSGAASGRHRSIADSAFAPAPGGSDAPPEPDPFG